MRKLVAFGTRSFVEPAGPRQPRATELVDVVATLPGTQAESRARTYVVSGDYDGRPGPGGNRYRIVRM